MRAHSRRSSSSISGASPGTWPATLAETASHAALRDRYTIYGLIGDVLRGNSTPDDAYSARIFERMKREGARIEPGFDLLRDE